MANVKDNILNFVSIVFLLLGALFGMLIMTFIFAQLGPSAANVQDDLQTVVNLTDTIPFLNQTLFQIPEASNTNFTGGFTVLEAWNETDGTTILLANFTVFSANGSFTNSSILNFTLINLTYSFTTVSQLEESLTDVQNNSLQAVVTYTDQSNSQFLTSAITITLLILIGLFAVFWRFFIGTGKKDGMGGGFG